MSTVNRVEFLQDVPIADGITPWSKVFRTSDGWNVEESPGRVVLTHPKRKVRATIDGVPFVIFHDPEPEPPTPPPEPEPSKAKRKR